jgi:hypothetical protein
LKIKRERFDTSSPAHQTIEAAIAKAPKLLSEFPLFVAGKSLNTDH